MAANDRIGGCGTIWSQAEVITLIEIWKLETLHNPCLYLFLQLPSGWRNAIACHSLIVVMELN
jgi:hypothetical protein